jgi:PAS domain S-box-containing protein
VNQDAPLSPATVADQLLAVDVFSELLASTDPSQLGQRLTEQIRELTGARTVMLVAHVDDAETPRLVHACPQRRAGLFTANELGQLCPDLALGDWPRRTVDLPVEHPLRPLLVRAGIESILRFPLRAAHELLATLLLLDMPGVDRIDETAAIVTHLSPVMALALKNSLAHQRIEQQARELERRVAERTAELEAANTALSASHLAAVNTRDEAVDARRRAEQTTAELRHEIAERRRAEESLRQSELRLRDITSSIADWVWEVDEHGVYTYSSAKGDMLIGDAIGKTPFDFMPPEEAKRVAAVFAEIAANRAPIVDLENWNIRKDGKRICLLTNGVPVFDSEGTFRGYRGVDRDITERKSEEAERAKLEAQLQQAQKMESVGRLAGGVAHDFNNMLGAILGHAELALDQVDPAQSLYADLEEIRKAATRSADLTRQLLAFARKQTVAPKVLDLNATVVTMLTMLQRLIGEDINLTWQPAANLWKIRMDPSQIDQILANLCVNARDAIAGVGKVTIQTGHRTFTEDYCATHPGFTPGDYVLLAVSDDGCGMDKDTLAHIFDPFFTTKAIGQGTGLGLATVYGIVKQNNGSISVNSDPNHGTTFRVYLPRHGDSVDLAATGAGAAPAPRGHETILLVEDEIVVLTMATKMLTRQGYPVLAANTPGEAIRLAREHAGEIHLLVTDVVMPEMNGRVLAKQLLSRHPRLKRLFMSGYTADIIAHRGVLEEGVHFIQKPFSIESLAAAVREALDDDQQADT